MGRFIQRVKLTDSVGFGMGFAAVVIAAGAAFSGFSDKPQQRFETIGEIHQISIPVMDAEMGPPDCLAEVTAYAAAVLDLRAAQQTADEAYRAWYRCQHNGQDPPPPPPKPDPEVERILLEQTVSVLEL